MNSLRVLTSEQKNSVCTKCPVKDHSALKDCPVECLEYISGAKGVIAYLKGQRIVMEGTVSPYIYFVKSGKIKIITSDGAGNEMIIRFAKSGDIIGFEDVELSKEHRLTAIVIEDTLLCYLEHTMFLQLMRRYPEMSMGLLKYYKEEFQAAILNSAKLAGLNVPGKVAYALLIMLKAFGRDEKDHTLNLALNRKDIASLAYTTKEQVSKIFSLFREQGFIKTSGNKKIALVNMNALQSLAQL